MFFCVKDLSAIFSNRYCVVALAETYLFYSSLTLVAMGCSTLVLSILFRLKHHWMKRLPRSLSANVFDKTFNVFNPYPDQRGIIHSTNFISMLPAMIVVVAFTILIPLAWALVASGLVLSVILLITCLNLMLRARSKFIILLR